MKNKNLITTIVLILVVGGVSFFGGVKYQQNKKPNFSNQLQNSQGVRAQGGQKGEIGQNAGTAQRNKSGVTPVNGEIISSDDKSVTVKLVDGSSKIVILSDNTSINKAAQGTRTDLSVGQKVLVMGQTNTDGSITAQNIQLNPTNRIMGNETAPAQAK